MEQIHRAGIFSSKVRYVLAISFHWDHLHFLDSGLV